ncbi:hypothetical protein CDCA_CDCA10G2930 [Cyanidium caldarium]|uniref:RecA family profile 1 domain-containing protein n=1 Tax=Cyanidium caldarium TaxID=2771 RepID=A0AAV9IXS6_CYACA|nr:hypothetical protein CDCA_CDCA10G2930 [Cyanidium caldarium]
MTDLYHIPGAWSLIYREDGKPDIRRHVSEQQQHASETDSTLPPSHPLRQVSLGTPELNTLLGGAGIPCGSLTELWGHAGAGKTRIGIQACIEAVRDGQSAAVYIDTEGGFSWERWQQWGGGHTPPDALHVYRVWSLAELLAARYVVEEVVMAARTGTVRLVVLDSVAFPFRAHAAVSPRTLLTFAAQWQRLAYTHNVAVLMVNHSTIGGEHPGRLRYTPALGPLWQHVCAHRIYVAPGYARVTQSALCPEPDAAPMRPTQASLDERSPAHHAAAATPSFRGSLAA